ncbi:transcription factor IIA subunit alpha [Elasticomyces elasticus]|uniref:Transcription factor IIA subunit alpha n=1 Tax=Elasticomyces elasticus TaxID=574655 RepID=A0AAN7W733_9PEZI|nr:transcription factor IIA subunit alpha [Elasticomyces elasticus]
MSNLLVGDVYGKIIEAVIRDSKTEFEENGVSTATLSDLEKEWKHKLSQKDVAHMSWDPKPVPPQPVQQVPIPAQSLPSVATNHAQPSYSTYHQQPQPNGATRIKVENGPEQQYHGLPNSYPQSMPDGQGGQVRAAQLAQQYAQARGIAGGLALPGQRPQSMQPQNQTQHQAQQMYMHQQRQQQAALQQQQAQPRIKVENESPQLHQGGFQQHPRPPNPAYAQTDGADEGLEEWQAYIANRRVTTAEQTERTDHMMRDAVLQNSASLESGLMMTLDELPKGARSKKRQGKARAANDVIAAAGPSIPQLDGDYDEDEKPIKDEDDVDAINSDLDSEEDPTGDLDEDDDDFGDSILCTYDKVQRVKNKWKCVLKDGVMSINKKEWVFHKGTGEFEW